MLDLQGHHGNYQGARSAAAVKAYCTKVNILHTIFSILQKFICFLRTALLDGSQLMSCVSILDSDLEWGAGGRREIERFYTDYITKLRKYTSARSNS